ncbi:hypothetical protein D5H75_08170 [Bailinhaonella thermotolerans]|uniref:Uncharacterized protein n=1 Tax=Bailinhaonella thermotolerans TaxID=1070861 RepID=A0A3A4B836_9ACTN|nr:hypothetical protein D5H75_08170 [Bailinhaonella thermotolerans]
MALGVLASLVLASGPATALAGAEFVRWPGGQYYWGPFQGKNAGPLTVAGSGPSGTIITNCANVTLSAHADWAPSGTPVTFTGLAVPACPNNVGGTTTITAENLPYLGSLGSPVPGGGSLVLPDPDVRIKMVLTMSVAPVQTCYYGFGSTVTQLHLDLFNPDNPARPVPSAGDLQAALSGDALTRLAGSTFLCPATVTLNGVLILRGEIAPGVFEQKLAVLP